MARFLAVFIKTPHRYFCAELGLYAPQRYVELVAFIRDYAWLDCDPIQFPWFYRRPKHGSLGSDRCDAPMSNLKGSPIELEQR